MLIWNKNVIDGDGMEYRHQKIFGLDFQTDELKTKDLPLYLSAGRSFWKYSWAGLEFVLVRLPADERFGVVAFEKQAAQLSAKYGMPVAFHFEYITRTQRDSLIERNIPFISASDQLFLPFLGIALRERFAHPKIINTEKMMPATQALFLYMLYKSKGKPIMKKDAAAAIGVTRTSLTRASEQLSAMNLISEEIKGKEYYMTVQGTCPELYKKAKPFLINPVQKTVTVQKDRKYLDYPLSGESALAMKTMLNDPRIPTYAVWKASMKTEKVPEIDGRWEPDADPVQLELWKYNPALFAKDGVVDPVSLAMSFEENADERIEDAIEEYLEGYQW